MFFRRSLLAYGLLGLNYKSSIVSDLPFVTPGNAKICNELHFKESSVNVAGDNSRWMAGLAWFMYGKIELLEIGSES